MPRPTDTSRLRRLLMQSIMWLVLAATVGLAAWVDARKARRGAVTLGPPTRFEQFSVRLPLDWETADRDALERDALLELHESDDEFSTRVIDVRLDQLSFFDAINALRRRPVAAADPVPFGDRPAMLNVYVDDARDIESGSTYYVRRCEVSRPMSDGRVLTLKLSHLGFRSGTSGQREQAEDVQLVKTIAATLTIEPK